MRTALSATATMVSCIPVQDTTHGIGRVLKGFQKSFHRQRGPHGMSSRSAPDQLFPQVLVMDMKLQGLDVLMAVGTCPFRAPLDLPRQRLLVRCQCSLGHAAQSGTVLINYCAAWCPRR